MENNFSYWEKRSFFEQVDIVVAGSGIVGLFTALEIKRKNPSWKILILERGILPNGASTKNAGFSCFGSLSELLDDLQFFTPQQSVELVKLRYEGLQKLRRELKDENIGFDPCGGFELFSEKDDSVYQNCLNNMDKYNELFTEFIGKNVYTNADQDIKNSGFGNSIKHLIKNNYEGSINTGKAIINLIKKAIENDILILNNVAINKWEEDGKNVQIFTDQFRVKSRKLIVTTNGFAKELLPELDVQPARAQVLVTSPIEELSLNGTFHYDRGYNYFRNIDGRILLGGGRNLDFKGENTTEMQITDRIQSHLENMLKEIIIPGKKFTVDYRWSGIMGVGSEKKPIVRKVGENVFVAVRMGGMGVAIGSKIGEMAATLVSENL